MGKEEKAILEDLQEYLEEKGIQAKLEFGASWVISCGYFSYYYSILNGSVVFENKDWIDQDQKLVVSLSDPNYREKIYEHIKKSDLRI